MQVAAQTFESAKTFLQDAPEGSAGAAGSSEVPAGGRRGGNGDAAAGLRSRRREVEMSETSHEGSTFRFDTDAAGGSRKDD